MSFQDVFWDTRDISKITCAVMNKNTNHPAKTRALEPSTMSCAQNASISSSCRHAAHIQFGSTCFGYFLLRENKYCKCHGQDMINHGSDILWIINLKRSCSSRCLLSTSSSMSVWTIYILQLQLLPPSLAHWNHWLHQYRALSFNNYCCKLKVGIGTIVIIIVYYIM